MADYTCPRCGFFIPERTGMGFDTPHRLRECRARQLVTSVREHLSKLSYGERATFTNELFEGICDECLRDEPKCVCPEEWNK